MNDREGTDRSAAPMTDGALYSHLAAFIAAFVRNRTVIEAGALVHGDEKAADVLDSWQAMTSAFYGTGATESQVKNFVSASKLYWGNHV